MQVIALSTSKPNVRRNRKTLTPPGLLGKRRTAGRDSPAQAVVRGRGSAGKGTRWTRTTDGGKDGGIAWLGSLQGSLWARGDHLVRFLGRLDCDRWQHRAVELNAEGGAPMASRVTPNRSCFLSIFLFSTRNLPIKDKIRGQRVHTCCFFSFLLSVCYPRLCFPMPHLQKDEEANNHQAARMPYAGLNKEHSGDASGNATLMRGRLQISQSLARFCICM
jgi:hypothetical protein